MIQLFLCSVKQILLSKDWMYIPICDNNSMEIYLFLWNNVLNLNFLQRNSAAKSTGSRWYFCFIAGGVCLFNNVVVLFVWCVTYIRNVQYVYQHVKKLKFAS